MSFFRYSYNDPSAAAVSVRAYLENRDGIEKSWSDERARYMAEPQIAPWFNGRERGFIVSLKAPSHDGKQINIAFFEARSSDCIVAWMWFQTKYTNPLNIDSAELEDAGGEPLYHEERMRYDQSYQMADWIYDRLEEHWENETLEARTIEGEAVPPMKVIEG